MLTSSFEQQIDCVHSIDVVELMWGIRSQLTDVVLEQTTENLVGSQLIK